MGQEWAGGRGAVTAQWVGLKPAWSEGIKGNEKVREVHDETGLPSQTSQTPFPSCGFVYLCGRLGMYIGGVVALLGDSPGLAGQLFSL